MEKSCGAVLYKMIDDTPYFVLVRGSVYGFPKGHVEDGETEVQTALREIREETGVTPRLDPRFRREIEYASPVRRGRKRVVFFLAECADGEDPHPSHEIRSLVMKPYAEAMGLLRHVNLKKVLEEANAYIRNSGE